MLDLVVKFRSHCHFSISLGRLLHITMLSTHGVRNWSKAQCEKLIRQNALLQSVK